jgi:hypothetical protein
MTGTSRPIGLARHVRGLEHVGAAEDPGLTDSGSAGALARDQPASADAERRELSFCLRLREGGRAGGEALSEKHRKGNNGDGQCDCDGTDDRHEKAPPDPEASELHRRE